MGHHRRRHHGPRVPYFFRLQRRLFVSFALTILVTGALFMGVMRAVSDQTWQQQTQRLQSLVGAEFAQVWDRPDERAALAERIARELHASVEVRDARGAVLQSLGPTCRWPMAARVEKGGQLLGEVRGCAVQSRGSHLAQLGLALLVVVLALWMTAGRISGRILRPLGMVVRVAEQLGEGKLDARVQTSCLRNGEERIVAESLNRMADRIEKQIADQRELLSAVSHEMRTPLGHMRLISELARTGGLEGKALDELEKEIAEMDTLVGDLLANSRLQFSTLSLQKLDGSELAQRALERAGLPAALLESAGDSSLEGDATLLGRALANLLENARRHGGGATKLSVRREDGKIRFDVEDAGPGFKPGDAAQAFDELRQKTHASTHGALGLGLNLVRRIAAAHGGEAWAGNREGGGAKVGFSAKG
ncbi:MAG: HAMP domain-containing sensor histidine kinase [Myxococcales bacterium]